MCQEADFHALSLRRLFYLFKYGGINAIESSLLLSEMQSKGHKREKPYFTGALLGGAGVGGGRGSLGVL